MTDTAQRFVDLGPDWMSAEMPSGYHNRVAEILRLTADLEKLGRYGRLLTGSGPALAEIVRDLFSTLQVETALLPGESSCDVSVRVPGRGRLLFHASSDTGTVAKKSGEIAAAFQLLHGTADEQDRVVLVTNPDPNSRPSERSASLADDAETFVKRMGVNHVSGRTLFELWKLSLPEPEQARAQLQRLLAHEGGTWELPATARA